MYYVIRNAGVVEGPFAADWVRTNVRGDMLVSYQQQWVPFSRHPDFIIESKPAKAIQYYTFAHQRGVEGPYTFEWILQHVPPDVYVSHLQQWVQRRNHPHFSYRQAAGHTPSNTSGHVTPRRTRDAFIASAKASYLLVRAAVYLAISIGIATVLLVATDVYVRGSGVRSLGKPVTLTSAFEMTLTWLLAFAIVVLPAYLIGRLLGGRGRLSEVVYGFARSAAALYVLLPFSLFLYWRWLLGFKGFGAIWSVIIIPLQVIFLPAVCIFFGFLALRTFVRSMHFAAAWRAWCTVVLSLSISTLVVLFSADWFHTMSQVYQELGRK